MREATNSCPDLSPLHFVRRAVRSHHLGDLHTRSTCWSKLCGNGPFSGVTPYSPRCKRPSSQTSVKTTQLPILQN